MNQLKREGRKVFIVFGKYLDEEQCISDDERETGEIYLDEKGYPCYRLEYLTKPFLISPLGQVPLTIIDKLELRIKMLRQIAKMENPNQKLFDYILYELFTDIAGLITIRNKPIYGHFDSAATCKICGGKIYGRWGEVCSC